MINLQNILQTSTLGTKGKNSSQSPIAVGENAVGSEFENLLNAEVSTSEAANGQAELMKLVNSFAKENNLSNEDALKLLQSEVGLKTDPTLSKEVNPQGLESLLNQPKPVKIGVDAKKEVTLTEQDFKNLELIKDQVAVKQNSASNISEILNQLKGAGESSKSLDDSLPVDSQKIPNIDGAQEEGSPLDFIMKGSKEKSAEVPQEFKNNKLMMQNHLSQNSKQLGDAKTPAALLGSSDFVSLKDEVKKSVGKTENAELKIQNLLSENQAQVKGQAHAKMYGKEQNLLAQNVISKPSEFFLKDEINKSSAVKDELKVSEFKTNNELQAMRQEAILASSPEAVLSKDGVQNNQVKTNTTFDMTQIKSSEPTEIMKQVSDYIQQSQLASKDQLDLTVKHHELGQFKINVSKLQGQQHIDLQITTQSKEAHQFFVRHENDLMRNLIQSGIQLSDLRVVAAQSDVAPTHQSESKQFYQGSQDQNSSSKQYASFESHQFSDGRERRKELWDEYKSRLSA